MSLSSLAVEITEMRVDQEQAPARPPARLRARVSELQFNFLFMNVYLMNGHRPIPIRGRPGDKTGPKQNCPF